MKTDKQVKKLEAKIDALSRYLGLEVCCEEDSDDGFYWCVVKRYKNRWSKWLR